MDFIAFVALPVGLALVDIVRGLLGISWTHRWIPTTVYVVVGLSALIALGWSATPILAVFVIANVSIGKWEFLPFSRFPMFSRPGKRSRTVIVLGVDGDRVATAKVFGTQPHDIAKLHRTLCNDVRERPDPPDGGEEGVRAEAAALLSAELERRRNAAGKKTGGEYSIVDVRLDLDGGRIVDTTKVLTTMKIDDT